jgi:hypothetical protein
MERTELPAECLLVDTAITEKPRLSILACGVCRGTKASLDQHISMVALGIYASADDIAFRIDPN